MIYFNFYTERWLAATVHMTPVQEAMYLRLTVWQYINECELPADESECMRIARAVSQTERQAVTDVLKEKFSVTPTGYAHTRITHEVARFQANQPQRVANRERVKARQVLSREIRRGLYDLARANKLPVRGGMTSAELRELLTGAGVDLGPLAYVAPVEAMNGSKRASHTSVDERGDEAAEKSGNGHRVTEGVTEAVTENVTRVNQETNIHREMSTSLSGVTCDAVRVPITPTAAGEACKAMRSSGIVGVNPSHPGLLALLEAGCTVGHLEMAAAQAVSRGKGFAYALSIAEGQLRAAAETRKALADRKHADAAPLAEQIAPALFLLN